MDLKVLKTLILEIHSFIHEIFMTVSEELSNSINSKLLALRGRHYCIDKRVAKESTIAWLRTPGMPAL